MFRPAMLAAQPERFSIALDDGALAGLRWRRDGAPRLLFCHATGFCAFAYRQVLAPLAGRFDIHAIDMRGHGRTTLAADPRRLKSWDVYARDIASYLDRSGPGPQWRLAGHSCGAVSATLAAKGRFDVASVSLIEPVATPPMMHLFAYLPVWVLFARRWRLVQGALARRAEWKNRDDALASYRRKAL